MATNLSRTVPTSVIQIARDELKRRKGLRPEGQLLDSWALPEDPLALLLPLAWIALFLLVGVPFRNNDVSVLPSFAPESPGQVLLTMWQVQAAITAIAFPFLSLLIELSRQRSMAVKSTVEVLTRKTHVMRALMLSIGGTAAFGVASAWLESDAMVVAAFVGILIPTMLLLARCYWVAFRLLSSPRLLKAAAFQLLQEKLRASMDSLWIYRRANTILKSYLPGAIQHAWAGHSRDQSIEWHAIPAARSGVIADVNPRGLLNALPLVSVATQESEEDRPMDAGLSGAGEVRVRLQRLCGDKVVAGDPLLLVDARALAGLEAVEQQIAAAFLIEEDV